MDWFFYSLFELGRLHADPHPGNFLFMPDGRLGLLDFGCTCMIAPGFFASLATAWNALLEGANAAARRAYVELGVIGPDLSQEQFDQELLPALTPIINWQLEPFRAQRFDFRTRSPAPMPDRERTRTLARFSRGMHPDLPYFDRAYVGNMQLLTAMGANVITTNRYIGPHLTGELI